MPTDRLSPILEVLAHPLRRTAIRGLIEEYLPLPVPSFATYLSLSLFPGAESDEFDEFRTGIHSALHHVHLPKLAEAGIIAYDPDLADGVIDTGPEFETAVAVVSAVEQFDRADDGLPDWIRR